MRDKVDRGSNYPVEFGEHSQPHDYLVHQPAGQSNSEPYSMHALLKDSIYTIAANFVGNGQ